MPIYVSIVALLSIDKGKQEPNGAYDSFHGRYVMPREIQFRFVNIHAKIHLLAQVVVSG